MARDRGVARTGGSGRSAGRRRGGRGRGGAAAGWGRDAAPVEPAAPRRRPADRRTVFSAGGTGRRTVSRTAGGVAPPGRRGYLRRTGASPGGGARPPLRARAWLSAHSWGAAPGGLRPRVGRRADGDAPRGRRG